ncbi:hypothetical protein ENC_08980 [Enterobacter hormaechei]|nr:hypothetical protein ENC_08980 [Enterobacter hormaechei]
MTFKKKGHIYGEVAHSKMARITYTRFGVTMDSMRIWRESLEQNFSISMKIKIDF